MNNASFYILSATLMCASLLVLSTIASAGDFYKWTDESGTVNFSDSLDNVPQKYRKQLEKREINNQESTSLESMPKQGSKLEIGSAPATTKKEGEPKKLEIPYTAYEGGARRIIIQVTFNDKITVPMLLDTGAPGMTISPELAYRLGLFDKGESQAIVEIGGIGGWELAVRTILNSVKVGDVRQEFMPAKIMLRQFSPAFEGILGMDVMGEYTFTINKKKRVVEIVEDPDRKELPAGRDEQWWRTTYHDFESELADWKAVIEYFEHMIERSSVMPTSVAQYKKYKAIAEWQYKEADNLLNRLDRYAAQHSTPVHWRRTKH